MRGNRGRGSEVSEAYGKEVSGDIVIVHPKASWISLIWALYHAKDY